GSAPQLLQLLTPSTSAPSYHSLLLWAVCAEEALGRRGASLRSTAAWVPVQQSTRISHLLSVCQIPGGFCEDSCVLRGIMVNKDVTHPRMRRLIKNPRVVLLDCSLEYKKGESQTDIEITREEDFARILQMEEEYIQQICEDLMRVKPDLVITEKGIS
ncbi:TCPG protein, partial [Odontophorus gujanensis]|nr:TCPG protein [Odontophorus gujanensis]